MFKKLVYSIIMNVERIVSFLPSATELVFELGCGDKLYGVTHECEYPIEAKLKLRIIESVFDSNSLSSKQIDEWVFGSCPDTGYAQISLPIACKRHNKKAVLFMAKRDEKNLTEYQKRGIELGVDYHWVENGMLTVTQKRAKDYAAESSDRMVLPLGLEHPSVLGSIIKVARSLPITPDEVWTVGSSGTLNRGLQFAWPHATIHVVSVGHTMNEREIGRAIYHRSEYKFDQPVKEEEMPPFPSAPTYDAKAWKFIQEFSDKKGTTLFWNVGA